MSTTVQETVSIDRESAIEACAHLMAADLVFVRLNDNIDSEAGDIFGLAADALQTKVFGSSRGEDDKTWAEDPERVEIYARAGEISADALEKLAARQFPPLARAKSSRELARRMRELGTVDTR